MVGIDRVDGGPRSAIVVGAGIVGLSTAWFLQERGLDVTVVDRGGVTARASWGNAGWIAPALTHAAAPRGRLASHGGDAGTRPATAGSRSRSDQVRQPADSSTQPSRTLARWPRTWPRPAACAAPPGGSRLRPKYRPLGERRSPVHARSVCPPRRARTAKTVARRCVQLQRNPRHRPLVSARFRSSRRPQPDAQPLHRPHGCLPTQERRAIPRPQPHRSRTVARGRPGRARLHRSWLALGRLLANSHRLSAL